MKSLAFVLFMVRLSCSELVCSMEGRASECHEDQGSYSALTGQMLASSANAVILNAPRCRIIRLDDDVFANMAEMKALNLSYNLLETLSKKIFDRIPGVTSIDLSYNVLAKLDAMVFHGISKLQMLNVTGNLLFLNAFSAPILKRTVAPGQLLDLHISHNNPNFKGLSVTSPDGFINGTDTVIHRLIDLHLYGTRTLPSVEETLPFVVPESIFRLSLTHNNLASLPDGLFHKCRRLFYLKLSHNRLEHLASDTFSRNRLLSLLHLQNNRLAELHGNVFKGNQGITVLDLRNNQLSNLPPDLITPLYKLKGIRLSNNRISHLPVNFFSNNTKLLSVQLDGNLVTSVDHKLFTKCPMMKGLDFAGNKLKSFPFESVSHLKDLKMLHLHNNEITNVPEGLLTSMDSLEEVTVYCNKLTLFPKDIDRISVKRFVLHGNPWKCGCLNNYLSKRVPYMIGDINKNTPLICIVGGDASTECNDKPVKDIFMQEWEYMHYKYNYICKQRVNSTLIL